MGEDGFHTAPPFPERFVRLFLLVFGLGGRMSTDSRELGSHHEVLVLLDGGEAVAERILVAHVL